MSDPFVRPNSPTARAVRRRRHPSRAVGRRRLAGAAAVGTAAAGAPGSGAFSATCPRRVRPRGLFFVSMSRVRVSMWRARWTTRRWPGGGGPRGGRDARQDIGAFQPTPAAAAAAAVARRAGEGAREDDAAFDDVDLCDGVPERCLNGHATPLPPTRGRRSSPPPATTRCEQFLNRTDPTRAEKMRAEKMQPRRRHSRRRRARRERCRRGSDTSGQRCGGGTPMAARPSVVLRRERTGGPPAPPDEAVLGGTPRQRRGQCRLVATSSTR